MVQVVLFSTVFLLSYFGVEWFRRWSSKKRIYDIPNERSSHVAPKPRGGGLIFVVVSMVFYSAYTIGFQGSFEVGYLAAAILISLVSWLDDLFSISFIWRFIVHAFSAFLIIYSIGYIDVLYVPFFHQLVIGKMGILLTFGWIVWLTNAYNFMDFIDGIAGTQAVTAGLGWFLTGKILGLDEISIYGGILAFSCAGFLIHNWQPAKIFMGDVGSAFLGFTYAVLPLLAKKENGEQSQFLPLIAVLLVWFFVFDAVYTFFRRLFKGEKVWNAHREHIYQKLVIKGYSHKFVTVLYGSLSLIVLISVINWLIFGSEFLCVVFILLGIQSIGLLIFGHRNISVNK